MIRFPGEVLSRGFWLYVWRVEAGKSEVLYVGRTGDNSSPNAASPYTRMGQHLGTIKNQNALRRQLEKHGITLEACRSFELVAHGPIYPEVSRTGDLDEQKRLHEPVRNIVGAFEMALASELKQAGYRVLNTVKWRHALDREAWLPIRAEFAKHFAKLSQLSLMAS